LAQGALLLYLRFRLAAHSMESSRQYSDDEWDVPQESGLRHAAGCDVAFDLYGPPTASCCVIFLHGFACGRWALKEHAIAIAARGAMALAVDNSSLTQGGTFREKFVDKSVRSAQVRNAKQVVEHAQWLDGLCGNPRPLAIIGHSAGGAIALEAAIALQEVGRPPVAVGLLDPVLWKHTARMVSRFDLSATSLLSIRGEPSAWNDHHALLDEALESIPLGATGRFTNLKINGSRHGDPMEHPSFLFRLLGLRGAGLEAYKRILFYYLVGSLPLPKLATDRSVEQVLRELNEEDEDLVNVVV